MTSRVVIGYYKMSYIIVKNRKSWYIKGDFNQYNF